VLKGVGPQVEPLAGILSGICEFCSRPGLWLILFPLPSNQPSYILFLFCFFSPILWSQEVSGLKWFAFFAVQSSLWYASPGSPCLPLGCGFVS